MSFPSDLNRTSHELPKRTELLAFTFNTSNTEAKKKLYTLPLS